MTLTQPMLGEKFSGQQPAVNVPQCASAIRDILCITAGISARMVLKAAEIRAPE
jgi:hypothetical protein